MFTRLDRQVTGDWVDETTETYEEHILAGIQFTTSIRKLYLKNYGSFWDTLYFEINRLQIQV